MPRRIAKPADPNNREKTFLREWRMHRKMSLARAAPLLGMSTAQLSRIETGEQPYQQDFLELAAKVYDTNVASLLSRHPKDESVPPILPLWQRARPDQREQMLEMAEIIVKDRPKGG